MTCPESPQRIRIALAAGGTGGHIMPTLALADALRAIQPDVDLLFFSGTKAQEIRWYGQSGIEPVQLPALPLSKSLSGKWKAGLGLLKSVVIARKKLQSFHADCVVGLGSYVAGATLIAAKTLGIPFVIHEQNSIAGKANRLLANSAAAVATTYPDAFASRTLKRLAVTGNPLRRKILAPVDPQEAKRHFGLDPISQVLLVFGASQGARGLNQTVLDLLRQFSTPTSLNWQVLWITGAAQFEQMKAELEPLPCASRVSVHAFVEEMGMAYAASDVVVCRASSSSLAEAAAWAKPMIAVPFPYSAEDHQRHNARFFSEAGACVAIDETNLTAERLQAEVKRILGSETVCKEMTQAARNLARPDADRDLAQLVLEVVRDRRKKINRI